MVKKYVYSDPHLGHANILNFERFEFNSIQEHDDYVVQAYNSVIKNDTTIVYWLGDVGKIERVKEFKGYKILIMGNHDRRTKQNYLDAGFEEVWSYPLFVHKSIILSHEPIPVSEHFINIHGHLHGSKLDSDRHFCVSAKDIWYRPVLLTSFDKHLEKLPKIRAKFLEEWYADLYIFHDKERGDVIVDKNGKIDLKKSLEFRKTLK